MTTIAILDMAHCGTTMLAQCVQALGVPMTLGGDRGHCEDAEVADALRSRETFVALVRSRSGQDWGFKHPGAYRFDWLDCLESPVYLAIYKDPVSVAWRNRREISTHTILDTLHRTRLSVAGIRATGLSVHCLSYLEAVRNPKQFVSRLAAICKLYDSNRIDRAAAVIRLEGVNNG